MSIAIFDIPIPVVTEIGDGFLLYVKSNGFLNEDEFCCVMKDGGILRYFNANQIKIWRNATYEITKDEKK